MKNLKEQFNKDGQVLSKINKDGSIKNEKKEKKEKIKQSSDKDKMILYKIINKQFVQV